jgi:hypothetical protein
MEKDSSKYIDKSGIVEEITQTKYGDHNLILYSDLATLEYTYLNYITRSLESLNEIILVLHHYHCVADVINSITNTSIDIDKYKKEGSLVVVQSKEAYYSLTHELVGVMIMTKMLIQRADKLGKAGVTVISDIIQEYASFICTCIIHIDLLSILHDDRTTDNNNMIDKDKATARLIISGYATLYYSAVSLNRHLLPM